MLLQFSHQAGSFPNTAMFPLHLIPSTRLVRSRILSTRPALPSTWGPGARPPGGRAVLQVLPGTPSGLLSQSGPSSSSCHARPPGHTVLREAQGPFPCNWVNTLPLPSPSGACRAPEFLSLDVQMSLLVPGGNPQGLCTYCGQSWVLSMWWLPSVLPAPPSFPLILAHLPVVCKIPGGALARSEHLAQGWPVRDSPHPPPLATATGEESA